MKRVISILLAAFTLTFVFASCSKISSNSNSKNGDALTEGNYTYELLDDGTASIVSYNSEESYDELEIPDTLGGVNVTVIGKNAFAGVSTILRVTFPRYLTTIENAAFKGSSIKYAMMNSCRELVIIGEDAFADCTKLVQVDISSSVTTIGKNAFANDTYLSVVTLRGDTDLDKNMFEGASRFTLWSYEDSTGVAKFAEKNGYEFKTLPKG